MQVSADIAAIPDVLNVTSGKCVVCGMVIRRNIHTGCFLDNARAGKTNAGRPHSVLVGGTAEETCYRTGVGVGIVKNDIQSTGLDVAAHGHCYSWHLDQAVGSFLNTDTGSTVYVCEEGITFLTCQLESADEFFSFCCTNRAATEGSYEGCTGYLGVLDGSFEGYATGL